MKVFIRGNAVLVQTDIKEDLYDNAPDYGVFTIQDEDSNQVFRLTKGPSGNINPFSITCNTVYQGKLAASFIIEEPENFTREFAPALIALKDNEETILAQAAKVQAKLDSLNQFIITEE